MLNRKHATQPTTTSIQSAHTPPITQIQIKKQYRQRAPSPQPHPRELRDKIQTAHYPHTHISLSLSHPDILIDSVAGLILARLARSLVGAISWWHLTIRSRQFRRWLIVEGDNLNGYRLNISPSLLLRRCYALAYLSYAACSIGLAHPEVN